MPDKKKRARRSFSEADVRKILEGAAKAPKLKDFLQEHRIYPNQFYQWKKKYGMPTKAVAKPKAAKATAPVEKKRPGRRPRRSFTPEQIKEILSAASKAERLKDYLDQMKIHYNQYYRWKKQYAGDVPARTPAPRGRKPAAKSAPMAVPEIKASAAEKVVMLTSENRQLKDTIAQLATELAQYKRYFSQKK